MAPPPAATLASGRSESRRGGVVRGGRGRRGRRGSLRWAQPPSRPPDLEKETEALAEDGERGAVPVGVEEGGACWRGMLWAEKPGEGGAVAGSAMGEEEVRGGKGK